MASSFDLGDQVFVQTLCSGGLPHIDIRWWKRNKEGERKPTKKGILLTAESWQLLLGANEQLVADIFNIQTKGRWVNKRYPIGEDIYASITSPWGWIYLSEWSDDGDRVMKPSRNGIYLKIHQWRKLMALRDEIANSMPDMS